MKVFTILLAFIIGLFVVGGVLVAVTDKCQASDITASRTIELTNQNRTSPVVEDKLLDKAAQAKADDMAVHGYFSHIYNGKRAWDFMRESKYDYYIAGENLAIDFSSSEALVQAWMNSPTHKANIVNPRFNRIGIGIAEGEYQGHRTKFVVEFFSN